METHQPENSEFIVTTKHPQDHNSAWKKVILACAFLMLFISLNIGAYVLAIKKKVETAAPTPAPTKQLSGDYAPPATIVHPPEEETQVWKVFQTKFFSLKYPPEWISQKDTTVENGVKIFNPGTLTQESASGSATNVSIPTQYLTISYHTASDSAIQYVDRLQLNCCIGPSAVPGAASRFKKQSLTVNSFEAYAYNTVIDPLAGWNYVFSDGAHLIEIFTSAPTSTGNSIENRIISTFTLIK